jgi:hypothetical protein
MPLSPENIPNPDPTRDKRAGSWSAPVEALHLEDVPKDAVNLNVEGRRVSSLLGGFGQMWRKTYRVRFSGSKVQPPQVIQVWRENFPNFWPAGNRFYGSFAGIKPGEVALLNLAGPKGITAPGGKPLISTGVLVLYADEESFTFLTPEGHMFAGMITFSAFEEDCTVAQIQVLVRANDPLYELGFRLGLMHTAEDEFWTATLRALAAYWNVEGMVQQWNTCVDPKVQWSQAGNIRHNAAIRTAIYLLLSRSAGSRKRSPLPIQIPVSRPSQRR